jgi:hypothetical protein
MKNQLKLVIALSGILWLAPAANAQDQCVELPAGTATINGSVKSALGAQAVLANVTATAEIAGYGTKSFSNFTSFFDGTFSIQVAAPATYVVSAAPFDFTHAAEFYDGVLTQAAATEFSVSDGQTVNGVDFTVVVGATMTGTVTAQQGGASVDNVTVQALPLGDLFALAVAQTDASGDFEIGGLAAQDYQVVFYPADSSDNYLVQLYDGQSGFPGDPVTVPPEGVSGIDAALVRGGRIEGTVIGLGGQPVESAGVVAVPTSGTYAFGGSATDANGDYSIIVPTGTHTVFVNADSGLISEYYDDQPDFGSADPVQVTAPGTTSGIDFQLAESGHITGRVTDSVSGDPIENATVTAYTADGTFVSLTSTNAAGDYDIDTNLRSGQYKVGFDGPDREFDGSPGYVGVFYSSKSTLGAANAVSVTAGQTTAGIDQQLVPCDQAGTSTTTTTATTTTTLGGGGVCGDPVALTAGNASAELPLTVTATDGLYVLRAAVGIETCDDCVCDVNGSGAVSATDALVVLQIAVGQPIPLQCPACS